MKKSILIISIMALLAQGALVKGQKSVCELHTTASYAWQGSSPLYATVQTVAKKDTTITAIPNWLKDTTVTVLFYKSTKGDYLVPLAATDQQTVLISKAFRLSRGLIDEVLKKVEPICINPIELTHYDELLNTKRYAAATVAKGKGTYGISQNSYLSSISKALVCSPREITINDFPARSNSTFTSINLREQVVNLEDTGTMIIRVITPVRAKKVFDDYIEAACKNLALHDSVKQEWLEQNNHFFEDLALKYTDANDNQVADLSKMLEDLAYTKNEFEATKDGLYVLIVQLADKNKNVVNYNAGTIFWVIDHKKPMQKKVTAAPKPKPVVKDTTKTTVPKPVVKETAKTVVSKPVVKDSTIIKFDTIREPVVIPVRVEKPYTVSVPVYEEIPVPILPQDTTPRININNSGNKDGVNVTVVVTGDVKFDGKSPVYFGSYFGGPLPDTTAKKTEAEEPEPIPAEEQKMPLKRPGPFFGPVVGFSGTDLVLGLNPAYTYGGTIGWSFFRRGELGISLTYQQGSLTADKTNRYERIQNADGTLGNYQGYDTVSFSGKQQQLGLQLHLSPGDWPVDFVLGYGKQQLSMREDVAEWTYDRFNDRYEPVESDGDFTIKYNDVYTFGVLWHVLPQLSLGASLQATAHKGWTTHNWAQQSTYMAGQFTIVFRPAIQNQ